MPEYTSDASIIGQIRWLTCPNCRRQTEHKILTSIHVNYENEPERDYAPFTIYYQFIACQGCQSLSVREISLQHDLYDYYATRGDPEVECDGRITLYDSIEHNFGDITFYREHIPDGILRIYESIEKSIHFAEPMLSGIGIRTLIENICNEQEFSKIKNLNQKIIRLQKNKKLSSDAANILHKLRQWATIQHMKHMSPQRNKFRWPFKRSERLSLISTSSQNWQKMFSRNPKRLKKYDYTRQQPLIITTAITIITKIIPEQPTFSPRYSAKLSRRDCRMSAVLLLSTSSSFSLKKVSRVNCESSRKSRIIFLRTSPDSKKSIELSVSASF